MSIATSPFASVQAAADAAADAWVGARYVAAFWIQNGLPFTSGHVVNALRAARGAGLIVNQSTVGHSLRDWFAEDEMPEYPDDLGGSTPVVCVVRHTQRTDTRTPVGTEVRVYAPDSQTGEEFDFELNIAEAPAVTMPDGSLATAVQALLGATPGTPAVQANGKIASTAGCVDHGGDLYATVHSDGRLCVPKAAFVRLAAAVGSPIVGGDCFYANIDNGDLVLTPARVVGSEPVRVTTDRLRCHMTVKELDVRPAYPINVVGLTIRVEGDFAL